MKLWSSASVIGLSTAYFAIACSSSPPGDGNSYAGTTSTMAGTSSAGTSMGGTAMGGSGTGGTGTSGAGTSSGGTSPTAGAGGTTPGGGTGGTGGASGGDGGMGGTGGGAMGPETEVACPQGVLGHCTMGMDYPTYPGYTLALVEDFPAPIDLDNDPIMTWSDGSPADGQTAFRAEQLSFADGKMYITAQPPDGCQSSTTNPGCIPPYTSFGEAQDNKASVTTGAMGVWSGELRSKYNNYRYGRYEAKFTAPLANPQQATMNNASGFLSTMFAFRTPKNVVWNEIDVELEPNLFNHIQGNIVSATFQVPNNGVGYPGGNASPLDVPGPAGYHIAQEHVYAFTWTPTQVEWFLDGQSIRVFNGSGNVPIPSLSAKIMMNLWVFSGDHFGPSAMNQYPIKSSYDWFHFYKWDMDNKYPCANPPACLDAADKTQSSQNNKNEVNYGQ